MPKGSNNEICACGHSLAKHELIGTEYSRCIDYTTVKKYPCKCAGGEARAVVWTDKPQYFKRTARGKDRPHALEGACQKALESGAKVVLLIDKCELCDAQLDKVSGQVYSIALDNDGRMYSGKTQQARGRKQSLESDFGHNRVICRGCDEIRGD